MTDSLLQKERSKYLSGPHRRYFFLSFAGENRIYARAIATALFSKLSPHPDGNREEVFLDDASVPGGRQLKWIEEEIPRHAIAVVLLDEAYVRKEWPMRELECMLRGGTPAVVVRMASREVLIKKARTGAVESLLMGKETVSEIEWYPPYPPSIVADEAKALLVKVLAEELAAADTKFAEKVGNDSMWIMEQSPTLLLPLVSLRKKLARLGEVSSCPLLAAAVQRARDSSRDPSTKSRQQALSIASGEMQRVVIESRRRLPDTENVARFFEFMVDGRIDGDVARSLLTLHSDGTMWNAVSEVYVRYSMSKVRYLQAKATAPQAELFDLYEKICTGSVKQWTEAPLRADPLRVDTGLHVGILSAEFPRLGNIINAHLSESNSFNLKSLRFLRYDSTDEERKKEVERTHVAFLELDAEQPMGVLRAAAEWSLMLSQAGAVTCPIFVQDTHTWSSEVADLLSAVTSLRGYVVHPEGDRVLGRETLEGFLRSSVQTALAQQLSTTLDQELRHALAESQVDGAVSILGSLHSGERAELGRFVESRFFKEWIDLAEGKMDIMGVDIADSEAKCKKKLSRFQEIFSRLDDNQCNRRLVEVADEYTQVRSAYARQKDLQRKWSSLRDICLSLRQLWVVGY